MWVVLTFHLVIPIVGQFDKPTEWANIVKDLDVVIDTIHTPEAKRLSGEILAAVSNAARELRPEGAPKLSYIYTSGTWLHGDNRNDVVTDTTPVRSPPELVAWRPGREQLVINDKVLNGLVIRPGLVYGRSASLLAPFFKSASEGTVWFPGKPGGRFALVHTDDLADLYVRAAEKAAICGGLIFDAVNEHTESVDDWLTALVKVSGAQKPYEYREPATCMFSALLDFLLESCWLCIICSIPCSPRNDHTSQALPCEDSAWLAAKQAELRGWASHLLCCMESYPVISSSKKFS